MFLAEIKSSLVKKSCTCKAQLQKYILFNQKISVKKQYKEKTQYHDKSEVRIV